MRPPAEKTPLTTLLLALSATLLTAWQPALAEDAANFEGWYQVDIILFKPRSSDLDEESWQEPDNRYPHDVVSVAEPAPSSLTQLEQLFSETRFEAQTEESSALGSHEFAFKEESRSEANRQLLESLTGGNPASTNDSQPEEDASTDPAAEDETADAETQVAVDIIDFTPDPYAPGQVAFKRVDDDSSLQSILRSLNRSSRFAVIDHASWIQPIDAAPMPVMFQAGQRYDDVFELEGTIALTRSRFLHVDTNLWYTLFEPRGGTVDPFRDGFSSPLPDEILEEYQDLVEVERQRGQYYPARQHAMVQSRRMRSDELHYLDHPLFGMLIRVNRYQPPASGD